MGHESGARICIVTGKRGRNGRNGGDPVGYLGVGGDGRVVRGRMGRRERHDDGGNVVKQYEIGGYFPQREFSELVSAGTLREAVREFERRHPTLVVDFAEGDVQGRCEVCGQYILGKERFYLDSEGVIWHRACPPG